MLSDMINELQGNAPGMDLAYGRTLINEAYKDVRRLGGWSFQFQETGFTVPGLLGTGTVTLQFGSDQVVGDADATAAWLTTGQYGSLITQRQFRSGGVSGAGTIYDIIAYDDGQTAGQGNYPFGTLTLNRPFSDPLPSGTGYGQGGYGGGGYGGGPGPQEYSIYCPYIVAPCKDFRRWLTVYDIANSGSLDVRGDRRAIPGPGGDPQRQIFTNPDRLLGLGSDSRKGSSTYGWQRYELWPGPQNQYLYQAWFLRFGCDLVNLSDELPDGVPESLVKARARARVYEQAEANKNPANPRGAGADFRFLIGEANKTYTHELRQARLEDRNKVDIFVSTMRRFGNNSYYPATYSNGAVQAQVGV